MSGHYVNNLTGDFSLCFSEHLTGHPNYLMIGQDGDMGYFINANTPNDHSIYANDLGALGSLQMNKAASDIFELINKFQ